MWVCPVCGRVFQKAKQPHSCKNIPLEEHFNNKGVANELFDHLVKEINVKIGKTETISLPCCIHLFGKYDFLAALPKKDLLEVRFSLHRKLDTPRLRVSVPVSARAIKNCVDLHTKEDIDNELIGWLKESYFLKD